MLFSLNIQLHDTQYFPGVIKSNKKASTICVKRQNLQQLVLLKAEEWKKYP